MKTKKKSSLLGRIALEAERKAIREHIEFCGTRIAAAKALGCTTETIRRKLAPAS